MIATVKAVNIRKPFNIIDTTYVVVKVNSDYFIIQRVQVDQVKYEDLPFITIWAREINYIIHNDGEYRIITTKGRIDGLRRRVTNE